MPVQLVVKNARLVIPEWGVLAGHLIVEDGRVAAVARPGEGVPRAGREIDADGRYVLPGAIDAHSHYGLFAPLDRRLVPESAYGVQGGLTTMVRYYRRPDSYLATVPAHIETNPRLHYQDFTLHLTLFTPEQVAEVRDYLEVLGVNSFKIYMNLKAAIAKGFAIDPRVNDTELQRADLDYDDGVLFAAVQALSTLPGRVRLSVHCEVADLVIRETARVRALGLGGLAAWHLARPAEAEALAILKVAYLGRQVGVPVFFPHIGTRLGIEVLAAELARGTDLVAETCPHYLLHNIESREGELLKVMPPVRTPEDNEATWAALRDGVITTVGSDHIPWTAAEKGSGDIWSIGPAFGSCGLIVPLLLSEGVARGRLTIRQLAEVTAMHPARAFGLYPRKGTLLPGSDADLIVVDPDAEWTVRARDLLTVQEFCVYEGWTLRGRVNVTAVRGEVVYENGALAGPPGHGRFIRRYPRVALDGE